MFSAPRGTGTGMSRWGGDSTGGSTVLRIASELQTIKLTGFLFWFFLASVSVW